MEFKQVIIIRSDLGMSKGKIAAQCCHASIASALKTKISNPEWFEDWMSEGQKKIVLKVSSKQELVNLFNDLKKLFPCELIKDAGLTELPPGSITCMGVGPVPEKDIDPYIKDLKLL